MFWQPSLPIKRASLPLQGESNQAALSQHVASGRSTRLLCTGLGFAVFMLLGVSGSVLFSIASHPSAKPSRSRFVPEVAAKTNEEPNFIPPLPLLHPGRLPSTNLPPSRQFVLSSMKQRQTSRMIEQGPITRMSMGDESATRKSRRDLIAAAAIAGLSLSQGVKPAAAGIGSGLATGDGMPKKQKVAASYEQFSADAGFERKGKARPEAGPQPEDIGIQEDGTNELMPCTDGKVHCLSSSRGSREGKPPDADLDWHSGGDSWWVVEPFRYDKPLEDAFADIKKALDKYRPGQRGIDGGGLKIIEENIDDDEVAYAYVQFFAEDKSYIHDMEFALSEGVCNVRTSSRTGNRDEGVNAKRYQWFADTLRRRKGWKTKPLRRTGHVYYFDENLLTDGDLPVRNIAY